jgi:hypothetical protein
MILASPHRSAARRVHWERLHVLVGIASWLAVAALWWLLVRQGKVSTEALLNSVGTVALVGAVALGVTLSWIRHNVSIYRERGPRNGRPDRAANTRADRLGRDPSTPSPSRSWRCTRS